LRLYPRRTAENSLDFLDCVIEEMPFAFQRIQSDRGREFFAYKFQERLMEYGIKFRPIKPRSPHLNGKVERSHKTDLEEFYPTVDLRGPALADRLSEWQHYYNWERPHGALLGKSPIDRVVQVSSKVLFWDDVDRMFDPAKERIQEQNYQLELRARKLKRSV
jgi:transposase InsO family protein